MLRTDPRALEGRTFDLVVVGGGIQGAAFAREAALLGMTALLLERRDFSYGSSSRSSRLVHGGVRYLQQGHIALVREALHERERLLRCAPHLVRPLPMLMPFFSDSSRSRWLLRSGLWVYDRLAGRSTMPRSRALDAARCVASFPGLRERGLRGGVLYYDAATRDAPLTLAVVEAAALAGAAVANYVEVVGNRDGCVLLRDAVTEAEVSVKARALVNAAGPRVDGLRQRLGVDGPELCRTSRGSHLVLAPREAETAIAAFLPDGRIQFLIPHRDGTLCGTTEVEGEPGLDEPDAPDDDVQYLLHALSHFLADPPRASDVLATYCGWRALPARAGPAGGVNREAFLVSERSPVGVVHTIVGGKLTTHRAFAERGIAEVTGRALPPSSTRTQPLPGGSGPREPLDPLWRRWGSRAPVVRAMASGSADALRPICPHRDFLPVEVRFAVREQAVVHFEDLAERRLFDLRGPCGEPGCAARLRALWATEALDLQRR